MKTDDLVVVRTFVNVIDAELAQGALESAKVDSFIQADDAGACGRTSACSACD